VYVDSLTTQHFSGRVRVARLRDDLSFTSFRHGGFTEGADSDLTDVELRAAGRHRSARQLPTFAKAHAQPTRFGRHKAAPKEQEQPICRNERLTLSE